MIRRTIELGFLLVLMTSSGSWLLAQQPAASVRDGVYNSEQSGRGEAVYRDSCASCHGEMLEGRGQAPGLTGSEFATSWNDRPAWELFDKIQTSMPADDPGQLNAEQTAAVIAYIFKSNNFPAGSNPLPAGADALKAIRIEAPTPSR